MPLTCVIIDDEYLAINILKEYAGSLDDLDVVHTFTHAEKALVYLREDPPDLLLLDIHMPLMTGIELLSRLDNPPLVIFTTAHTDYAVRAFELDVLDYLVKPVSFERFAKAIRRAQEYVPPGPPDRNYITVRCDHRMVKIMHADISHIEGLNEYVRIHTPSRVYITLAALKRLEEVLPPQRFIRVHKSYIVSRDQVASFTREELLLHTGHRLPIGRSYRDNLSTLS